MMADSPVVSIWSYEGRSSRSDYFVVLLVTSFLGAIAGMVIVKGGPLGFISGVFFVAVLWVSMCACARRLHDLGVSGWWSLAVLVPFLNFIFGLYVLFAPGQEHANDHGPSPKSTPTPLLPELAVSMPTSLTSRFQIDQSNSAAVNAEVITPMPEVSKAAGAEPMEEFWARALHECDSAAMKAGLWAKAFADASGDERLAKATYMRLRATQLQAQYDTQQQALKLARDQELQAEQERQKTLEAEEAELLAKAERAEALLPKGKCPACDAVISLTAEQCPKCTALFTSDSKWKVKRLTRYEAIGQKAADDAVIFSTRSKEYTSAENTTSLAIAVVLMFLFILSAVYAS